MGSDGAPLQQSPPSHIRTPGRLVLLRHGESEWNARKLFAGWYDTPLTKKGEAQARAAGARLRECGFFLTKDDVVGVSSRLQRACRTLDIVLEELLLGSDAGTKDAGTPVHRTWKLNERHSGALIGASLNEDQLELKRAVDAASVQTPVAPLLPTSPYYDEVQSMARAHLDAEEDGTNVVPNGESVVAVQQRVCSYFQRVVEPLLREGKTVVVSCHYVVVCAICVYLEFGTGGECDLSSPPPPSETPGVERETLKEQGSSAENRAPGFLDGREEEGWPYLARMFKRIRVGNAVPIVYEFSTSPPPSSAAEFSAADEGGGLVVDIGRKRVVRAEEEGAFQG